MLIILWYTNFSYGNFILYRTVVHTQYYAHSRYQFYYFAKIQKSVNFNSSIIIIVTLHVHENIIEAVQENNTKLYILLHVDLPIIDNSIQGQAHICVASIRVA